MHPNTGENCFCRPGVRNRVRGLKQGFIFTVLLLPAVLCQGQSLPAALKHAHAHNDYLHTRPLFDALRHGFMSVEADIHLKNGELLVGHDPEDLIPGQTLESLYLGPLRALILQRGGRLFAGDERLNLLVDVKTEAVSTYRVLKSVLNRYRDILTVFGPDSVNEGAVAVIISGNRDPGLMMDDSPWIAACDGRFQDLEKGRPVSFMPLISEDWSRHFNWRGTGPVPADELEKLCRYAEQVHRQGRQIRFWNTDVSLQRERIRVWKVLLDAGADWINTDYLGEFKEFMAKRVIVSGEKK